AVRRAALGALTGTSRAMSQSWQLGAWAMVTVVSASRRASITGAGKWRASVPMDQVPARYSQNTGPRQYRAVVSGLPSAKRARRATASEVARLLMLPGVMVVDRPVVALVPASAGRPHSGP